MAEERLKYIIEFDINTAQSQIKDFDGNIIKTTNSVRALSKELNSAVNGQDGKGGMTQLKNASGGATSSVLELGRVIQDSNYGMRGMANNITQLASSLAFTAKSAGGFVATLRSLWSAILGPAGLILAISYIVKELEAAEMSSEKTNASFKKLNEGVANMNATIATSTAELEVYEKVYRQATAGSKEHTNSLKELKDLGFDPTRESIDSFIEKQKELIILQATADLYKKQLQDLVAARTDSDKLIAQANNDLAAASERLARANADLQKSKDEGKKGYELLTEITEQTNAQNAYSDAIEKVSELAEQRGNIFLNASDKEKEYKDILEEMLRFMNISTGAAATKKLKEYSAALLDLSTEFERFRNAQFQSANLTEEQRLAREYEAAKEAVEIKRLEYKDKEDERLDARLKEIDDLKITEDEKGRLIADAYNSYNSAQIQANQDMRDVMLQADLAYYAELKLLREIEANEYRRSLDDAEIEYLDFLYAQDIISKTNTLDRIDAEEKANKALTEAKIKNLEEELKAKNLSESKIQNINNQIDKLENDRTLYQQQLDIKAAQTKIAIANQVANAIMNIAGEGSTIAKGVAIAQTIWNTKQGVMNALGTITPYGPWNIAQAAAIAAMGVKNVADIIATKAPNEKSSGVSASAAGGGTTFMPDFNIVGASGTNQLASTVAGQLGEPTRAYVVYDDLRAAGEIEANAVTAAGI